MGRNVGLDEALDTRKESWDVKIGKMSGGDGRYPTGHLHVRRPSTSGPKIVHGGCSTWRQALVPEAKLSHDTSLEPPHPAPEEHDVW
eukprot:2339219-Prymnesium_polylepis.2